MAGRERFVLSALGAVSVRRVPGRCIRARGGMECTACADACPVNLDPSTIDAEDGDLWSTCTACGACAAACPTDALVLADGSWRQALGSLFSRLQEREAPAPLVVACSHASTGAEDVSVRCLAVFDLPLVLSAWAHGASDVVFVEAPCADCPSGQGSSRAVAIAARANELAIHLAIERSAAAEPPDSEAVASAGGQHLDRRGLFRWAVSRGTSVLGAALGGMLPPESDVEGEEGAGTASVRRRVAISALRTLVPPGARGDVPVPAGPFSLSLPAIDGDLCTACDDCVRFCPTGALGSSVEKGTYLLGLDPADCVGCGVCEALCRFGAISMVPPNAEAIAAAPAVVVRCALVECESCGSAFASGDESSSRRCPLCARKEGRFGGMY